MFHWTTLSIPKSIMSGGRGHDAHKRVVLPAAGVFWRFPNMMNVVSVDAPRRQQ